MRDCFSNICKTDQPKSLSQGVPQLDVIILCRWGPGRLNYFEHLPGHLAGDCILWDTSFRTLKATGIGLETKRN